MGPVCRMTLRALAVLAICGFGTRGTLYLLQWAMTATGLSDDTLTWLRLRGDERQLNASFRAVAPKIDAKLRVADLVVEGKLTLSEAVARFRSLEGAGEHQSLYFLERALGERIADELWCRSVLWYVQAALRYRPEIAGAVLARLEAQVQELANESSGGRACDQPRRGGRL